MNDEHDAGPPPDEPPPGGAPPEGPDGERPSAAGQPAAWRLTFEYEEDRVRLVDRQPVSMLAPVDDTELLDRGQEGYWIEVRDADGSPLYQQVLHQPIQTHYEVFSPEPGVRPRHVAAPEVRGAFQAVVPDLADGAEVVLQGPPSAADPEASDEAADLGQRGRRTSGRNRREVRILLAAPLRPGRKGGKDHGSR